MPEYSAPVVEKHWNNSHIAGGFVQQHNENDATPGQIVKYVWDE